MHLTGESHPTSLGIARDRPDSSSPFSKAKIGREGVVRTRLGSFYVA